MFPCWACLSYLNVSNELQGWSLYRGLAVYDSLDSSRPPHGLIQHLGVEAVRVLPPIYYDVPVTWKKQESLLILKMKIHKEEVLHEINSL